MIARSKDPIYRVWQAMKQRCYLKSCSGFKHYGARGITVCGRWRDSFEAFVADMGPRPSSRHSIERTDTNGPYAPVNCRWATKIEQANNTRSNRVIVAFGESMTVAEAARRYNVSAWTLYRVDSSGQSVDDFIRTGGQRRRPPRKTHCKRGHPFDPATGRCRICKLESMKRWHRDHPTGRAISDHRASLEGHT